MIAGVRLAVCAAIAAALAPTAVLPRPVAEPVQIADGSTARPGVSRKRGPVPEVEPVVIGKVRYEPLLNGKARGLGQNGGDIVARDAASGAELWTLRVYTVRYAPNMEADKQDVFISDLAADRDGRTLIVTDEKGRRYRVDTQKRSVAPNP